MEKIKVCFRVGKHSQYKTFLDFPPDGVKYLVPSKAVRTKNRFVDFFKMNAINLYSRYLDFLALPSSLLVDSGEADLIHSGGGFMILNKKPWVLGPIEHVGDFLGCRKNWIKKIRMEKYKQNIEKYLSSEYCKKIMPYSYAGKKSIENSIDTSDFSDKIEVVPLVVPAQKFVKIKSDKTKLLFVGSANFPENFEIKGGRETLEAFKILSRTYENLELTIISAVPESIRSKYKNLNNLKIVQPDFSKSLKPIFASSDIFIHPNHFPPGSAILEAMSFNLPVITINIWAYPEVVKNGKNGFMVDPPSVRYYGNDFVPKWDADAFLNALRRSDETEFVNGIVEKVSLLIERPSLRKKMGNYGRKLVEKGRFSIKERNKQLRKIYQESIEN
jgi:glycosyltransferase involved in cell wall biosynthesis